jgi:hypothetical protein
LYVLDNHCAQCAQALDFCGDIVGFDIQVNATGVLHRLDLDMQLAGLILQPDVFLALRARQLVDRHAQGLTPETGGAQQVAGLAIDNKSRQFTFVHTPLPLWLG